MNGKLEKNTTQNDHHKPPTPSAVHTNIRVPVIFREPPPNTRKPPPNFVDYNQFDTVILLYRFVLANDKVVKIWDYLSDKVSLLNT